MNSLASVVVSVCLAAAFGGRTSKKASTKVENTISREMLLEAYRLSEKRLEIQQSFAVASDQRSLVLAGLSVAAAAFTAGLVDLNDDFWIDTLVPLLFTVSAVIACLSALPTPMHTPGAAFSDVVPFIEANADYLDGIRNLAENNDAAVRKNERLRIKYTRRYRWSIYCFIGSTVLMSSVQSMHFRGNLPPTVGVWLEENL